MTPLDEITTPLVLLLYRLRHAKNDKEWLRVHTLLSLRLGTMSADDIQEHVIRFYSTTHQFDTRVVERDIAALLSDIFPKDGSASDTNKRDAACVA